MRQNAPERCPSLCQVGRVVGCLLALSRSPGAGKRSDATASRYARLDQIFLGIEKLAMRKSAMADGGLMSPFFDPRRRSLQISLGSMIARRGALLTLVVRNKSANALGGQATASYHPIQREWSFYRGRSLHLPPPGWDKVSWYRMRCHCNK